MTKPGQRQAVPYFRASLLTLLLSLCGFVYAQETNLQSSVDEAGSALQMLDDKANACLSAADTDSQLRCNDFMSALDGELMASYLTHCSILKSWRDDFVTQAVNSNDTLENSEAMLQLLVAVEFNCAENALQRRTEYVMSAFALLRRGSNTRSDAELRQRLAELKFESTDNRERQALQNSVQQQQARRQLEIQRQTDALENELIRQQIRNSGPGN